MNKLSITATSPDGEKLIEIPLPVVVDDTGGYWPSPDFNPVMEEAIKHQAVDEVVTTWINETNPFSAIQKHLRGKSNA